MKFVLSLGLLASALLASAQPFQRYFTRITPLSVHTYNNAMCSAVLSNGNFLVAGQYADTPTGPKIGYVASYSRSGAFQYLGLLPDGTTQEPIKILTGADVYYVVYRTTIPNEGRNIGLAKFQDAGNLLFHQTYQVNSGARNDYATDAVLTNDTLAVVGSTQETVGSGSTDAFFFTINVPALNIPNVVVSSSPGTFDEARAVAYDSVSGRFFITGVRDSGMLDWSPGHFDRTIAGFSGASIAVDPVSGRVAHAGAMNTGYGLTLIEDEAGNIVTTSAVGLPGSSFSKVFRTTYGFSFVGRIVDSSGTPDLYVGRTTSSGQSGGAYIYYQGLSNSLGYVDAAIDTADEVYVLGTSSMIGTVSPLLFKVRATMGFRWSDIWTPSNGSLQNNAPGTLAVHSGSGDVLIAGDRSDLGMAFDTMHVAMYRQQAQCFGDSFTVPKNTAFVSPRSVVKNDRYTDSKAYTLASPPSHGTLTFYANGTFKYVPQTGYTGSDQFFYNVSRPGVSNGTAVVNLTVQ